MANQNNSNTDRLLKMYCEYGLSEPFARAIVEGKDPKAVMEFWNQDWHKQYPDADDVLVIAVLEQTITPEEGEWLNSVRSNHEALVLSCLDGSCTIEWAKSLMNAGFLNHSKEVSDILKGGDPIVIGMLSGIRLESDLLPPKLEVKVEKIGSAPLPPVIPSRGRKRKKKTTCRNCSRIVVTQPKCPHCKFRLLWEWDRLSPDERLKVWIFMGIYFPEVSCGNLEALKLMEIISCLDKNSLAKQMPPKPHKIGPSVNSEDLPKIFAILSNVITLRLARWGTGKPNGKRVQQFQEEIIGSIQSQMAPHGENIIEDLIRDSKL